MYQRLLSLVFFCVFGASAVLRAQAPAAGAGASSPGRVLVAQVRGTVTKSVNGQVTPLKVDDLVEQSAKVITARNSSVVLAFSNGATTQLGDDTELVIEEFLQEPFASDIKVAQLTAEPTRSNTKLNLSRGELVGKVAKLNHAAGSTFIVQTPVGAAGIRGTTFRIVFRPQGTGMAFFQLSTVEGNVNFSQGTPGTGSTPGAGPTAGQTQPQDQTPAPQQNQPQPDATQYTPQPQSGPTTPQPGAPAGGVPVVGGQEVVIQVSVNVSTAGQIAVAAPPQIVSSSVPISAAAQSQIVAQAQNIAVAVATTTFAATPPAASGSTPGSSSTNAPAQGGGEQSSSGNSGNSSSSTAGNSGTTPATPGTAGTQGQPGTAGNSGTTPARAAQPTQPPAIVPQTPRQTPGDGRGPGG